MTESLRLESLEFQERLKSGQTWKLNEICLGDANLIVGRNATGKTRTLNVVFALARFLSGKTKTGLGRNTIRAQFRKGHETGEYELEHEDDQVLSEKYVFAGKTILKRKKDGSGEVLADKVGERIGFKVPSNVLAAVAKRDSLQHPQLDELANWAESVRHFKFASDFVEEQRRYVVPRNLPSSELQDQDPSVVAEVLQRGLNRWKSLFTNEVMRGMREVGFPLRKIALGAPTSIRFTPNLKEAVGIFAKERDLSHPTDSNSMSQGMYRTLALLLHVHYFALKRGSGLILIDDVGEGLDFERSQNLIAHLLKVARERDIQIVMTSNDRFVLNAVPLEHWIVLRRDGSEVSAHTKKTDPDRFEEFELTGLSNFDLLVSDFLFTDAK